MRTIADAMAIIDSPLITTIVGIIGAAAITVTGAVIGLFVKVSSIASTVEAIQRDIAEMSSDKDIMRWSQWGPAHETRSYGKEVERRR